MTLAQRLKKPMTWLVVAVIAALLYGLVSVLRSRPTAPVAANAAPSNLAMFKVEASSGGVAQGFDGVVEAVRQSTQAAQVAGNILQVNAQAGDHVKAGQVLIRIDSSSADQNALAANAQAHAAAASLDVAQKDFERQKALFAKSYISQAALDQAQLQFKAAQANAQAMLAQSQASRSQAGYFVIKAPFNGIVSDVPVVVGDMAMPGKPLVSLYDPSALRVSAQVSASYADQINAQTKARIEVSQLNADANQNAPQILQATSLQILPTVNSTTHGVTVRLPLSFAANLPAPGTFARVLLEGLPVVDGSNSSVWIPAQAAVQRAEMTGVYVINEQGKAMLRQVRLGATRGQGTTAQVQVLSGLNAGESVALDPLAASRSN